MPLTSLQLSQRLKDETRSAHEATEALLVPKLSSIQNAEDYVAILTMFYGFFHPVQSLILRYINPSILPDISERKNTDWILKDLASLGCDEKAIQLSSTLPNVFNASSAMGTLYVQEGSTLGGRMIVKMLSGHPVLKERNAFHYFNGYGTATGTKWRNFQFVLDSKGFNEGEVIGAANETFNCMQAWIRKKLYS